LQNFKLSKRSKNAKSDYIVERIRVAAPSSNDPKKDVLLYDRSWRKSAEETFPDKKKRLKTPLQGGSI